MGANHAPSPPSQEPGNQGRESLPMCAAIYQKPTKTDEKLRGPRSSWEVVVDGKEQGLVRDLPDLLIMPESFFDALQSR
jgi:hypothetical protein